MKRIALVDFDDTLIHTDSLVTILKGEHLFVDIPLLFYGGFVALFAPIGGKLRHWARSRFKLRMLKKIKKLDSAVLAKYVQKFRKQINNEVVGHIVRGGYDGIVVVSAGETHLIAKTLDGIIDYDMIIANDWDNLQNFKTCWGSEKVVRVQELYKNEECGFSLYTDSFHDRFLMEICHTVYLIDKDGKISNHKQGELIC